MCTEMLKTDIYFADLFRDILTNNGIPNDWNKSILVTLQKKGDLQHCDNWRGITLLSVPSKIFCIVFLDIIEGSMDVKLRQEQAGFRRGKRMHRSDIRPPQHH